jgi:hypothetical protein
MRDEFKSLTFLRKQKREGWATLLKISWSLLLATSGRVGHPPALEVESQNGRAGTLGP